MTTMSQILSDIRNALGTTYFTDRLNALNATMTIDAHRNSISVILISPSDSTFELFAVHHGDDRWSLSPRKINTHLRVSTSMRLLEQDIAREMCAAFGSEPSHISSRTDWRSNES